MTRRAACSCGQLHLTIEGEPPRISMCHCLECQRRTGAVISNQARFPREQVTISGKSTAWIRTAESGNVLTFHFCPTCGSTVYWENEGFLGYVAVAIGNFADPNFPAPTIAVWEETRHPWVSLPPDTPPKRMAKQGCRPQGEQIWSALLSFPAEVTGERSWWKRARTSREQLPGDPWRISKPTAASSSTLLQFGILKNSLFWACFGLPLHGKVVYT